MTTRNTITRNMSTRRRFVAQAGALAAAAFVSTSRTRALAAAAKKKLGFALCGLGGLATGQIAPALQKTQNCRLAGIITGNPAEATSWKTQYGITDKSIYGYDTMHRMADNADIDVVYVLTQRARLLDDPREAAKASNHRFGEKPMKISVERCQQMMD